ncbi:MAG: hypothetical protein V1839_02465 [archaeon]
MKTGLILLFISMIFISGCVTANPQQTTNDVINACLKACDDARAANTSLENGPCLLNPIPQYEDWVCDVVNSPRKAVDNLPANQCSAFLKGKAKHFVEVTPECLYIKTF